MTHAQTRFLLRTSLPIAIYLALGNARSIQPNPFIDGAVVAVNMIVPVVTGALFGRYCGLCVGLIGTALNALSPAGSTFESLAIVPHGIMGFCAGWWAEKFGSAAAPLALILGHLLNIAMFVLFRQMASAQLAEPVFWLGLGSEAFAGVIASNVIVSLYRLCFENHPA